MPARHRRSNRADRKEILSPFPSVVSDAIYRNAQKAAQLVEEEIACLRGAAACNLPNYQCFDAVPAIWQIDGRVPWAAISENGVVGQFDGLDRA